MEISMDVWMYWVTAAIFTAVGYSFAPMTSYKETKRITQETIDTLIDMKYIRTRRDENNEIELVRYDDLEEDL